MTDDSTPSRQNFATRASLYAKKMIGNEVRLSLHASSDALFFVRLFARACCDVAGCKGLRVIGQ